MALQERHTGQGQIHDKACLPARRGGGQDKDRIDPRTDEQRHQDDGQGQDDTELLDAQGCRQEQCRPGKCMGHGILLSGKCRLFLRR